MTIHQYHILLNTWSRYGAEHYVVKLGRRWHVHGLPGGGPNRVWTRKHEAVGYVDSYVLEQGRRRAAGASGEIAA